MSWVDVIRPLEQYVPSIVKPPKEVNLNSKFVYVMAVLTFYLMASKIPLYGIRSSNTDDPLSYYRVMLASNRGTLMELGISPIVTSGMILQGLVGAKILTVDRSNSEHTRLYGVAEKITGLITIFGQAIFYTVFSGMYGSVWDLGLGNTTLIVLQLVISGCLVLLLDDMLQVGYGFGSAISLFISTGICQSIFWQAFSYQVAQTMTSVEYEGAIINLIYVLTQDNKLVGLKSAFFRTQLPNISNLMATAVVFCVVIFFQGFRVDIPIRHTAVRKGSTSHTYPIRLFYTSTVPIMIQSAFTSTLFMTSSILHGRFRGTFISNIFGRWILTPNGRSIPVGGLVYYISSPKTMAETLSDPIHTIVYVAYVLISCSIFSTIWLEFSGSGSRDVANNLRAQGLTVLGYRQNTMQVALDRYIPTAAALGGLCTGTLSIFSEFMGALGSGTGILLAVGMILNYVENIQKSMEKDAAKSQGGVTGLTNIFS